LSEVFPHGDITNVVVPRSRDDELPKEWGSGNAVADEPRNNLSVQKKLEYALAMAEAVAEMHGFADGVIVHDDIHLGQFLVDWQGILKCNDYNRAEPM
jgi:hypothetical protein